MNSYPTHFQQDAQVIERLTRVEEKLDALLDKTSFAAERTADHDIRIRSLETANSKMLGMGFIIAAIAGLGGSQFLSLVSGQ